MSFILLGILNSAAGGGGQTYYIGLVQESGAANRLRGVTVDSQLNAIFVGENGFAGTGVSLFAIASDATELYQKKYRAPTSTNSFLERAAIFDDNSVYGSGSFVTNNWNGGLLKWDSTGAIVWARILGSGNAEFFGQIAIDSSGNVVTAGYKSTTGDFPLVAKWDSSGNLLWQRQVGSGGMLSGYGRGVDVDSSGNVYLSGYGNGIHVASNDFYVMKINSSGTLQWNTVYGASGGFTLYDSATDASGNTYIVGNDSTPNAIIAKFDSSGNLVWQKFAVQSGHARYQSVAIDPDGNVYAGGYYSSFQSQGLLTKYDSSGNVIYQRKIGYPTGSNIIRTVRCNDAGDVFLTMDIDTPGASAFVACLAGDGSTTGNKSLAGYNYQVANITTTTGNAGHTAASGSLALSTPSFTAASHTLNNVSRSLTLVTGTY